MTDDNRPLFATLQEVLTAAARCSTSETKENYYALAGELRALRQIATQSCASHLDCGAIVNKLRAGSALSATEMATVRLLIVGDADLYVKYYNNEYKNSKNEIQQNVDDIRGTRLQYFSLDELIRLIVLCRQTEDLSQSIQRYLDARDRIQRFEATIKAGIGRDTAYTLAILVEQRLAGIAQAG